MSNVNRKRVAILGATGSIGKSARRVAQAIPERMEIVAMSAHNNTGELVRAAAEFPKARTVVSSAPDGEKRLIEMVTAPDVDMVLVAIVGIAGLRPALAAIEAEKDLAVASKEILVMAGREVMEAARRRGVRILPVDSEHNAIFQCLEGRSTTSVRRILLTCSGGPFLNASVKEISRATPEQALQHPTWAMGRKISIDSATLFNKGLEMIEARWLFDVPMSSIEVIIHPQSVVHSMVEFVDGSVLAQMSHTDMCFPIQYAVTWPERVPTGLPFVDFTKLRDLHFEAPRRDVFPALDLARRASEACGVMPAVYNAANEIAVSAFLEGKIRFLQIAQLVARALDDCPNVQKPSLDDILAADADARARVTEWITSPGFLTPAILQV